MPSPQSLDMIHHTVRYPDDVLAGLLTPKVAMCGQKFQLTVDNVTFVGYPSFARRVASQVCL